MIVEAKLVERIKRTSDIESFRFSHCEAINLNQAAAAPRVLPGRRKISFYPGQFVQVVFDRENITNPLFNKYLSFSSSPDKDYIEVTKRISTSQFSQKLQALAPGDSVLLNGPMGNCVFKNEYDKICFITGGVGITPAISMIEFVVEKKLPTDILLIYSNRSEDDIAFKEEINGWCKADNKIKARYVVTGLKPKDNKYLWGVVNKDLVLREVKDWDKRIFFIFGPPKMVGEIKRICVDMGCPDRNIKAENFIGY